jgi:uncharacterized protein YjlB
MTQPTVTAIPLEERKGIPNNPRLPVLLYEAAFPADTPDLASAMEKRFAENGWPPQWRDGVYDFHHYHSRGHEVLGIVAGSARIVLGGAGGRELALKAGDVLLLPAGTGHCRVAASENFLAVGAYPPGQSADILRDPPTPAIREAIAKLTFPVDDPVRGQDGPLSLHWVGTL